MAAKKRNLNEVIDSQIQEIGTIQDFTELTNEEFENQLPQILHTSCYLSFIAVKSKSLANEDILGDEGVIHEISHYMLGVSKKSLTEIRDLVANLQRKAIGLYEPV